MLTSVLDLIPRQRNKGISIIPTPNEYDVLCGKDKTHSKHPGNVIYREKIAQLASQYAAATSKPAKMFITRGIVESMQNTYHSRFLRPVSHPNNGSCVGYMELTDQQARDKTSHALRFHLKNSNNNTNEQTQNNSDEQPQRRKQPQQNLSMPRPRQVSIEHAMQPSITVPSATTTNASSSMLPTVAIPIHDPMYALLQHTMFVTASPFVMNPTTSHLLTASSSTTSQTRQTTTATASSSTTTANNPIATAMDVDMSLVTNSSNRNNDTSSLMNGNTLRSEDLNAIFNSSMNSIEHLMVMSVNGSDTHSERVKTDTLRSEDLNRIFNLEEHEWDAVMKD